MSKKYIKDYRLNEFFDAKGKVHTDYEYIGGSFFYIAEPQIVQRKSRQMAATCAVGWISWLLPLLFNNGAMRLPYISVPFIFSALTLWLLSSTVYITVTASEPLKHKQSDRLNKWIPGTSLATSILAGIALLGLLVSLVFKIGTQNNYDILFAAGAALECACGILCFTQGKFFRTEER